MFDRLLEEADREMPDDTKPPIKMTCVMPSPTGEGILRRLGETPGGPMTDEEANAIITRIIEEGKAKRRDTD